jgi:undecaprenyl-diphosphatase
MSVFEAIILGIIQGLSEFIPISSTAHLTIAGHLMGLIDEANPEHWTAFIATIQLGTLAAVLIYFKNDIFNISKSYLIENFSSKRQKYSLQSQDSKMGWFVIIGTLPIVIIGLAAKDIIEGSLTKDLNVIAGSLIALAVILALAEKVATLKKDMTQITWKDSLIVGLSQCLALIPGASRSGTTITAGLFIGLKRETAARFSFLLSIPALLASGLLSFYQALDYISTADLINYIVATAVSGISGYAAIAFLISFLRRHTTFIFIYYRIALGAIIIILLYNNIL